MLCAYSRDDNDRYHDLQYPRQVYRRRSVAPFFFSISLSSALKLTRVSVMQDEKKLSCFSGCICLSSSLHYFWTLVSYLLLMPVIRCVFFTRFSFPRVADLYPILFLSLGRSLLSL